MEVINFLLNVVEVISRDTPFPVLLLSFFLLMMFWLWLIGRSVIAHAFLDDETD